VTKWPWPGDNATERARRIANSLLALLPAEERPVWTARAHDLGETWLGETLLRWTADDAITGDEAAQLVHVSADTIRQWATLRHPEDPQRKLLPRFKMRGRHRTYLVRDVLDASAAVRRGRLRRIGEPT
jgi:hypothetical protein